MEGEFVMGKVKSYMMDIEENVYDLEGLEEKISESEDISEVKSWVVDQLGLKTHFDIGIANGAVTEMWNELWGGYVPDGKREVDMSIQYFGSDTFYSAMQATARRWVLPQKSWQPTLPPHQTVRSLSLTSAMRSLWERHTQRC